MTPAESNSAAPVRAHLDVGFLIDRWDPARGGAERALESFADHLIARGHRVRVFAGEREPSASGAAPIEFVHVRRAFGWSRSARERLIAQALVDAADRAGAGVTVGVRHLARVDLLWPHGGSHRASLAALRAARAWNVQRPARIVDVEPRGRHRTFVAFEEQLYARGGAHRIACVSELVRTELALHYPAARERLFAAPNGIDLDRFHPRERNERGLELRDDLGLSRDVPLIALAARQPVLKGLPVLYAALSGWQHEPWNLLVAGPRDADAWRKRASVAGIAPARVHVTAHADPVALAAAADLCVLPTWRDTCGLVVLEALACGTPVVTTARAGVAECVRESAGEVVAEPGDVLALRASIARQLARVALGIDRESVRAHVLDRGARAWLTGLERELEALSIARRELNAGNADAQHAAVERTERA